MKGIDEVIITFLDECIAKIRANMEAENINASGKTSAGIIQGREGGVFFVEASEGAPPSSLELGVKPEDIPDDVYFKLLDWASNKGIYFEKPSQLKTFCYFVSKRLKEFGYGRPSPSQYGQKKEVIYTPLKDDLQQLKENLKEAVKASIFLKEN